MTLILPPRNFDLEDLLRQMESALLEMRRHEHLDLAWDSALKTLEFLEQQP